MNWLSLGCAYFDILSTGRTGGKERAGEQNTNKAISLNLKTKLVRKERYFPAGVGRTISAVIDMLSGYFYTDLLSGL